MPKISIVIPTYNNFESFKRTFDSVLSQFYQDYEILITDDSTQDDIYNFITSVNLIKVKYFRNSPALGVPENWNEGIRRASGEYIKILHHDDWFASRDALGKFVMLLDENPQSDFGYSKSVDVDIYSGKCKHRKAERYVESIKENFSELIYHNRIGAPSVTVFRKNSNIYFDQKLKWLVDVDFYIQAIIRNKNLSFLNEELVKIGIHEDRLTNYCDKMIGLEEKEQAYLEKKITMLLSAINK